MSAVLGEGWGAFGMLPQFGWVWIRVPVLVLPWFHGVESSGFITSSFLSFMSPSVEDLPLKVVVRMKEYVF